MATHGISASFSLAAIIGMSVATSAAAAQREVSVVAEVERSDVLSERVSYADLDLASADGVRRLNFRVSGAVRRVCDPLDERRTFSEYGSCRSFARDGAEPQIAQAVARAREIAHFGTSAIAPVAIVIAAPRR